MRAQRRTDRAGKMRAPLAPVETRTTQHASPPAAPRRHGIDVDAELGQQLHAGLGHQAAVLRQLDLAFGHHGVRERDPETAGKVVVAGAGGAQRGIARADRELRLRRLRSRRHQHDAFHHLRHRGRGQPMVAMPSLLLDFEQTRHAQARQMGACRLRRDAGDAGELGGG